MPEPRSSHDVEAAEIVSQIIRARQARTGLFRPELFSDPAWDMLLVLFVASVREQIVTATELAEATATPISTAIRWIDVLERDGLLERNSDPASARRDDVGLSVRGKAAIYQWLEDCKPTSFFTLQHSEEELGGGRDFRK
jgi:DNA-binding MarR family transcriptional regulator